MSKTLVSYVLNDQEERIGVIVAVGPKQIGWSKCNTNDFFDRKKGKQVAEARANHKRWVNRKETMLEMEKGSFHQNYLDNLEGKRWVKNENEEEMEVHELPILDKHRKRFIDAIRKMEERAKKYFKDAK